MQIFAVTKALHRRYKNVTERYKNVTCGNAVATGLSDKKIEYHVLYRMKTKFEEDCVILKFFVY